MKMYLFDLIAPILLSSIFLGQVKKIVGAEKGESSSTSNIIERFENITKGGQDKRSYRGLKLANDLRILLVSDPGSETSGAGVNINVGSLNDSDELPGMAHLVGQMLDHSGNSAHPERGFIDVMEMHLPDDDFVYQSMFPPRTEEDRQSFFFHVAPNHLSPALEIFAQYICEPLFMTSNSKSPLEASIDSLQESRTSDISHSTNRWRILQLEKSISSENHAFRRSPYGVPETFLQYLVEDETDNQREPLQQARPEPPKTILHDKLRTFYSKWYSSNLMSLIVFGRESLDQLESLTVPLFENIQNKRVEKLNFSYEKHPWGQEQLRHKIFTAFNPNSLERQESIRLVFRVPDIRHQYKTAPDLYVINLLKRWESGSLISLLDKKRLCMRLVNQYYVKAGIGFLSITCEVYDSWKETDVDKVLEFIFQYIRLIKQNGINEWLFTEYRRRNEMTFLTVDRSDTILTLASVMHDYPMNDIISYKYLQDTWDRSLIEKFLTHLTPENMNKKYLNIKPMRDEWHKIPYKIEIISNSLIEKLKTMKISSDLHLPQPNEFISENLNVYSLESNEPENPYMIHESSRSRIWFLQDNSSAKVHIKLNLVNLQAHLNPSSFTLLCIFAHLLDHVLAEHKYAFLLSGYKCSTEYFSDNFFHIHLQGYSDKIQVVLKKIMSKITDAHLLKDELQEPFEKAKLSCIIKERDLEPRSVIMSRLKYVLTESAETWSRKEINATAQSLLFMDWTKFLTKFIRHVFVQGLIMGNCDKQKVKEVATIIETSFESELALVPQEVQTVLPRVVEIEKGKHFLDIIFVNYGYKIHSYQTYYQLGLGTSENTIIALLLLNMVAKKCVNIMEDLVMAQHRIVKMSGVIGLVFWISHTDRLPNDIDSELEKCMKTIHVLLQQMPETEFEEYVKSVAEKESNNPSSVTSYWGEIVGGFVNIQQDSDEKVADAELLTKMDVLSFFEDTLFGQSPNHRKYSILLLNIESNKWTTPSVIPNNATRIDDVMTFKNASSLLPLPSSWSQLHLTQHRRMKT